MGETTEVASANRAVRGVNRAGARRESVDGRARVRMITADFFSASCGVADMAIRKEQWEMERELRRRDGT